MQTSEQVGARFGLAMLYDRLFTVGADGTVKGYLADTWEYDDQGTQLKIGIRDDVKFRDGTPLDAAVVKVNLDRARTLESPVVKARMAPVTDVEVTGPFEVTLKLASPTTTIPFVLAEMAGFIMHPDLIEDGDPQTEVNGSGAYVLESFAPGEEIALARDGDYWHDDGGSFAHVEMRQYRDPKAFSNALAGGQVEIGQLTPSEALALEGRAGLKTVWIPQGSSVDLALNMDAAPLDELEVRQAINFAIDRDAITEAFYPNAEAKWQYYRDGLPGNDPALDDTYSYDPDRARSLLTEAGHPDGVDIGTIIVGNGIPSPVGQAVQEQLSDAGIVAKIETVDSLESFARWAEGNDSGFLQIFTHGTNAAVGMRDGFVPASRNPAGVTPEWEALMADLDNNQASTEEFDSAARAVNAYVVDQAWRVPISWSESAWVMSEDVQGLGPESDYANVHSPVFWSTGLWKTS